MPLSQVGLFCLATLAMALSPGPAVLLMLSLGLRDGSGAVLKAAAGIAIVSLLFLLVSALGLVAALTASATLFSVVSYAGAAYLAYLGLRMVAASRVESDQAPVAQRSLQRPFLQGALTHLSNPKALLYWSALFPQFVDPQRAVAPRVLMLGGIGITLDIIILCGYGLTAARARRSTVSRRFSRLTLLFGGGFLLAASALLALARWRST